MPAKAGIQSFRGNGVTTLDPRLRGDDEVRDTNAIVEAISNALGDRALIPAPSPRKRPM